MNPSTQSVLRFPSSPESSPASWLAALGIRLTPDFQPLHVLVDPEGAQNACLDDPSRAALESFTNLIQALYACPERFQADRPAAVAEYLHAHHQQLDQEVMGALFVDMRNRIIADEVLFTGTLTRAAVEPRAILRTALMHGAAGIVIFHTHPSGDPAPSRDDIAFTERMRQASEVLGVRLLDHLIVGASGQWVSLKRRGIL